jgi:hypothetical protein
VQSFLRQAAAARAATPARYNLPTRLPEGPGTPSPPKKPIKNFSGGKGGQQHFAAFCSVLWRFAAFWGELATTTNAPQKYMTGNKMYHRCFGGSKKSNQTDREMLLQFVNIFATNDFMRQWTIPSCCPTHFAPE